MSPTRPGFRPAIVLSSYTMALGVVRALGEAGVPVVAVHYASTDIAHVSRWVTERVRTPRPLYDEVGFVDALVDAAGRYAGGVLIPASDSSLVAISRHAERLRAASYLVAAPPWQTALDCIEKVRTVRIAEEAGVPVPRTAFPATRDDAERYAEEAVYPCIVKPSVGHAYRAALGRKMTRVDDPSELLHAYDEASRRGLDVMLQELIPGPDHAGANYNAYAVGGRALVEFTATKLRSSPPLLGSPCAVRSDRVPGVLEPGRLLLRAMHYEGFACTEFKLDPRDGTWKLMEVNARHNLSGILAPRCGVNFPLIQYRHLVDGVDPSADGFATGVHWVDLVRDLQEARGAIAREGFAAFARAYRRPRVFAVGDLHDPKPLLLQLTKGARSALARLTTRGHDREAREAAVSRSTSET